MKKIFAILFLLIASIVYADTVHVFVPVNVHSGDTSKFQYKIVTFHYLDNLELRPLSSSNYYHFNKYHNVLDICLNNGKMYHFVDCKSWVEPDDDKNTKN